MNVGCYIILTPRLGGTKREISNERYIYIYSTGLEWLTNCCSASFVAKSGSLPPWMVLIFSCESSNTLYYWISDKLRKHVDSFISDRTYSERENQRMYAAVALNPLKRGLGWEQVVNGRRRGFWQFAHTFSASGVGFSILQYNFATEGLEKGWNGIH